ncbi:MAG TPA: M20/M25/M40 family metallo-hydrolase [Gemmatimonadales bacterium]
MKRLVAAAGMLTLAQAAPLHAQGADPVIQRIWNLGMDSSHTEMLARQLFDSLGPRLTGSPGQKAANDWLVKTYTGWGIEAKNEQYGTWRGWRRGYSHIDLVSPRTRSLEGTMLAWSPGTLKKDLTATTVVLPKFADSTEFIRWLPNAKGKFVLLSVAMPTCRPNEDWTRYATAASHARMDSMVIDAQREWTERVRATGYSLALGTGTLGMRLEQAGAAGFITSRDKDAWGSIEIFETYDTKAPAVALSCEDYSLIYRLSESNMHPMVTMNLDADLLGERPVFNTVAKMTGSTLPNEYVFLSAHFDSWDGSSGSTDNGTGTLTMLEAMRILKQVYPHPKRTIMVGHWSAEEEGLVGSRAFTEDHPEVISGLQVLFNQDNGTGRVQQANGGGFPDAATHLSQWFSKVPPFFQDQVRLSGAGAPGGGGSDHASFACHGVPAIELGSLDWNYSNYTWHTNRDTYDKIVFDDLRGNATLVAMLAYLASEDATKVTRDKVDLNAVGGRGGRGLGADSAFHVVVDTTANGIHYSFTVPSAGRGGRGGGRGGAGRGGRGGAGPRAWPECPPVYRTTHPRL